MKIATPLLVLALAAMSIPMSTQAEPMKQAHCDHASRSHGSSKLSHESFATKGLPPHLVALSLSDSQQDRVFELIHPQVPQIRQFEKQRDQLIAELQALSNSASFDSAKAKQVSEKLSIIEKEAMFNRAATDNQIFLILTPEQRKQLVEMKPHHAEGFSKGRFQQGLYPAKKLARFL